jgi:hypothetical protein
MAARYAAKRLVAVEVRPNRSNQHEFNAGLLRKALGIEQDRISGPLTLLFYTDDSGRAEVDESEFTLYDAREGQAHRGPEYRLYYTSRAVERHAREDDLLVVQRPARGNKLLGVVARSGTDVARELAAALELGDGARLQRFVEAKPHAGSEKAAEVLGLRTSERRPMSDVETHPVYLEAVRTGVIPPPKVLAKAGRVLAVERHGDRLSPDDFLLLSMEAETDLFFAIERAIKGEKLATLAARGAVAFDAIMEEAKRIQQSRRSRRGLSLQDHFAALLDRERIPYASQCKTELGETPDFVVPGSTEYHDARYPSDRLRMVACKSTSRERWRQVLTEAARVPQKFLLTLDEKLSRELVVAMRRSGLRVFMPDAITNEYADGFGLETVSSLVAELRAATDGANR